MIPHSNRVTTANRKRLKNPDGFTLKYSLSEIGRFINVNVVAVAKIRPNSNFP